MPFNPSKLQEARQNLSQDIRRGFNPDKLHNTISTMQKQGILSKVGKFTGEVASTILKPIATSIIRPIQLEETIRTGKTPTAHTIFGDIEPPKPGIAGVKQAIGTGLQTVSLGLPAVSGGAAYFGGEALEKGKSVGSALFSAGLGALGGKVIKTGAGLAGKGIKAIGKNIGLPVEALKSSAAAEYADILKPTTRENKIITAKIAPEMAERRITSLTKKQLLTKANTQVEKVGQELEKAYEAQPQGTQIFTGDITNTLEAAKNELKVKGTNIIPETNRLKYELINNLQNEFNNIADESGATLDSLRSYKVLLDKNISKKTRIFGITEAETAKLESEKIMANTLRRELARQFPDVAKINTEFTFWKRISDVLGETIQRQQGQKPLGKTLATAAGAAGGLAGGGVSNAVQYGLLMRELNNIANSTAYKTVSASNKMLLARALSKADIPLARKIVGRMTQQVGKVVGQAGKGVAPLVIQKSARDVIGFEPRKRIKK